MEQQPPPPAAPASSSPTPLYNLLCAFRDAVLSCDTSCGSDAEQGHVFQNIREEVRRFCDPALSLEWGDEADARVQHYMLIPDHSSACKELNFQLFSKTPLMARDRPLHVHHILEAFSKTTPARFATVWLPLLDCFEACRWAMQGGPAAPAPDLQAARQHLRQQQQQQQHGGGSAMDDVLLGAAGLGGPGPANELDAMMQNILSSFPGLQGMVQQMLQSGGGGAGPEQGIQQLLGQVQGLLQPLLAQACQDPSSGAAELQPAVGKILEGFAGLTQALGQQAAAAGPPTGGQPMMEAEE